MPAAVWIAIGIGLFGLALAVGLIGGEIGVLSLSGLALAVSRAACSRTTPSMPRRCSTRARRRSCSAWPRWRARRLDGVRRAAPGLPGRRAGRQRAPRRDHDAGLAAAGRVGGAGTAVPYLMTLAGISRIGPTPTTVAGMIEPVLAVLLSWAWLGQTLTVLQGSAPLRCSQRSSSYSGRREARPWLRSEPAPKRRLGVDTSRRLMVSRPDAPPAARLIAQWIPGLRGSKHAQYACPRSRSPRRAGRTRRSAAGRGSSSGRQRIVARVSAFTRSSHAASPHQPARTNPPSPPRMARASASLSASNVLASRNASASASRPACCSARI